MDMSQLQFVLADTNVTPDTGKHSASNTIKHAGPGVRAAAATAAQALLGLASTQLGVPVAQLSVSKGVVSGGGKTVTYGAAARRASSSTSGCRRATTWPAIRRLPAASRAASSRAVAGEAGRASTSWSAPRRRGSTSRTIVTGQGRLHPEHPRARDAARADRAARAARRCTGSALRSSRSTRARSRTSPASGSCARRTSSASSRRRSTTRSRRRRS